MARGEGRARIRRAGARVAAFLAGQLALLAGLYAVGAPRYAPPGRDRIRAMIDQPERVEAVVWGSSHAQAIALETVGLEGENLYVTAQDLLETSWSARSLAPRLPGLRLALVSLSYFSFVNDNGRYRRDGRPARASIRIGMYARYPLTPEVLPGDGSNALKALLHPLVTEDHWRRVFLGGEPGERRPGPPRRRPGEPLPTVEAIRRAMAAMEPQKSEEELATYAEWRCADDAEILRRMRESSPTAPAETFAAARALVDDLRGRGVRVVFFTPPYYRAYNGCYPEEARRDLRDRAARLVAETGVEYYDYSTDPGFEDEPRAFVNADHMNGPGRRLFSALLRDRLGLPSGP